jgi:putative ABC transport system permease protein
MKLHALREGVGIALDALRSNKVRAGLTVLGIVIGVATVVAMAALITGIRTSIMTQVESVGRHTFVVNRFDFTEVRLIGDGSAPPWAGRPEITVEEARMLASLPSIRSVTPDIDFTTTMRRGDRSVSMQASANSADWPEYTLGDFVEGRNFLPHEVERSTPLVVISDHLAEDLFGQRSAIGQVVRMEGQRFEVVGVYRVQPNIFSGLIRNFAVVPYTSARKYLGVSTEFMALMVVPHDGVVQERAMDEVTAALRISRGLRPTEENDFALIRQEAFAEMFDRLTGVFFLVMLVLSSIGLMVGGVGVVAVMMISVTERTREIGVRKALGATRREILWQFLVEAATVTVVGAAIGLTLGIGGALLLAMAAPIPAMVPLWAIAAALAVAALSGVGFGLYPAWRAARLDPVEALRYE